ncbi:MAG: thioredoxin family protein [Bradymonadia bacterium]
MIQRRCTMLALNLLVVFFILSLGPAWGKRAKRPPIKWPTEIAWQSFEMGQQQSAETGKPMMILIYADWCTQCVALAKALKNEKLIALSKKFVMVLANQDDESQGVFLYTPKLSYVPRILFMKPDGEFWSEMTSHDTRYPYFYQVSSLDQLMSNMRESIRVHGKK